MRSWKSSNCSPFYYNSRCCFTSSSTSKCCGTNDSCSCSPRCSTTKRSHRYYYGSSRCDMSIGHCPFFVGNDRSNRYSHHGRISRGGGSLFSSLKASNQSSTGDIEMTAAAAAAAAADRSSSSSIVNTSTTSNDLSKYHLVTSPNVPSQILMWTFVLYIMRRFVMKSRNVSSFGTGSAMYNYIVLPLLSSACCSIQLLVNAMFASVGCVGFNKILGPLRPFFVAWLLLTTHNYITQTIMVEQQGLLSSVLRIGSFIIMTWTMALLPEFIHWKNTYQKRGVRSEEVPSSSNTTLMEIHLTIPSMGCVACIQKVTNSLQGSSSSDTFRIQEASSWLKGGDEKGGNAKVLVEVPPSQDPEKVAETLAQSVKQNGFQDCQVDTIQKL